MKIIAQTAEGFLLAADADEIAHILGYRSVYGMTLRPQVGQTVPVDQLFRRSEALKAGADDVLRISKTLRALADLAAEAVPALQLPDASPEVAS